MNQLTALELLQAWEQGLSASPVRRALCLLAIAFPEYAWADLTQLSIGRRDALLLTLREWLFGTQLASVATCPNCGERLEFTFAVADVQVPHTPLIPAESILQVDDYTVRFRLPNSLDLEAAASCQNPAALQQQLLQRCLLAASRQETDCELATLPETVRAAIAARMAQDDPQADVQIALTCPACHHQWQATFDIVHFLWNELHAWAQRTLIDVHRLALAYGWREADILAMSPQRRQFYLGMVNP
ncbi:MAG: phage baseplate protein [Cyanobacteria bacterium P01_D01_bin.14]